MTRARACLRDQIKPLTLCSRFFMVLSMSEMNFELARSNMIVQQIRPWDVLDERLLETLQRIPREEFVPAQYRNLAFTDMSIPLGRGQAMMAPKLEARLVQALALTPTDKVLEVGTGSAYVTAVLAALAKHVYSVDIVPEFKMAAERKLAARGITNVTLDVGDAARGWDRHGPYDAILITGSLASLPDNFRSSLALGGRLVAVVGASPAMQARWVHRLTDTGFDERALFETDLAPLVNAQEPAKFIF